MVDGFANNFGEPYSMNKEQLQEAVNLVTEHGSIYYASVATGMPETTLRKRYQRAVKQGVEPTVQPKAEREVAFLNNQVKQLKAKLAEVEREELGAEEIRRKIFKIAEIQTEPPGWVLKPSHKSNKSPGVPTLFCSDWHWAEVVDANQMGGVTNAFDLKIARDRARYLVDNVIDLLFNHMVNPEYPGIVLALGGDMFSGDILHEELTESNEEYTMQAMLDLLGVMTWMINQLLEKFPNVFVVGVTGNHGRNTKKVRHKNRAFTSFDWLLYQLIKRHYHPTEGKPNQRVSFMIPDGPDAYYRIYNHRYLLTHGDQFRGGDGITGALMPIMRGFAKKSSRNAQINQEFDTMIIGHWHHLFQSRRVIVNGSLKGYDEYAYALNLPFEQPMQALWVTHPDRGITFSIPVHVEPKTKQTKSEWVSIQQGGA